MSLKNSFFEKGRLKFATIKFTLGKFISPKKHWHIYDVIAQKKSNIFKENIDKLE